MRTSDQYGAFLTRADFATHHSTSETPISAEYRGRTVYECPPNSQGLTALLSEQHSAARCALLRPDPALREVAGDTGIVLQNRGPASCSIRRTATAWRPASGRTTIIPCLVLGGDRLWSSFGVLGGCMQPQGHVQMLVNMLDHGMNSQEALDAVDRPLQRIAGGGA